MCFVPKKNNTRTHPGKIKQKNRHTGTHTHADTGTRRTAGGNGRRNPTTHRRTDTHTHTQTWWWMWWMSWWWRRRRRREPANEIGWEEEIMKTEHRKRNGSTPASDAMGACDGHRGRRCTEAAGRRRASLPPAGHAQRQRRQRRPPEPNLT